MYEQNRLCQVTTERNKYAVCNLLKTKKKLSLDYLYNLQIKDQKHHSEFMHSN